MRDDPGFDSQTIADTLESHYGIHASETEFLPIGHDMNCFAYRVAATDGATYFLKIRALPIFQPGLLVPRALIDCGIKAVLAPLRSRDSRLWSPLEGRDGFSVVLYPYIHGENA